MNKCTSWWWLALPLWLTAHAAQAGELTVGEAWVRAVPPVSGMTAGYLVLENGSDAERTLVGAASPDFDAVQMHRSVEEGGVARMIRQERIPIEPGGRLIMAPGGYHLMLMGFKRPLKPGDSVTLELELDGGETLSVVAPVRASGGGHMMDHAHHHHHDE